MSRQISSDEGRYGLKSHRRKHSRGFMVVRLLIDEFKNGEDEIQSLVPVAGADPTSGIGSKVVRLAERLTEYPCK